MATWPFSKLVVEEEKGLRGARNWCPPPPSEEYVSNNILGRYTESSRRFCGRLSAKSDSQTECFSPNKKALSKVTSFIEKPGPNNWLVGHHRRAPQVCYSERIHVETALLPVDVHPHFTPTISFFFLNYELFHEMKQCGRLEKSSTPMLEDILYPPTAWSCDCVPVIPSVTWLRGVGSRELMLKCERG